MGLPTTRSTKREGERSGAIQLVCLNKTFFNDLCQVGGEEKREGWWEKEGQWSLDTMNTTL